jgi:hypothetical protein
MVSKSWCAGEVWPASIWEKGEFEVRLRLHRYLGLQNESSVQRSKTEKENLLVKMLNRNWGSQTKTEELRWKVRLRSCKHSVKYVN